jgi:hypothetical protein
MEVHIRIVSGEEKKRVKVVNKEPDNLLVQWVPGEKAITEIFKEMKPDQTKHASKLIPEITEEMISGEDEDGSNIFEVVKVEDSSRAGDEDEEDPFAEDPK